MWRFRFRWLFAVQRFRDHARHSAGGSGEAWRANVRLHAARLVMPDHAPLGVFPADPPVYRVAVTFDEWDAARAAGAELPEASDEDWGRGNRPVMNVSPEDAEAYCRWLSERTGQTYRLPSEAEWEYACRAGTDTPFWWGSSVSTEQANYDGNFIYGDGTKGEYREQTVPVDSFEPNSRGLCQMHGNVYEWCADP